MCGVRPNSPIQITSVLSSSPRSFRSVTSAAIAESTCSELFFTRAKLSWCVSHPPSTTSTNGTPTSTSRRAISTPGPNRPLPYFEALPDGSADRSNALASFDFISRTARS